MAYTADDFRHVSYLWNDAEAAALDAVERLRYRSNLLGADQRITNTGGGNTSSKIVMRDPLSGDDVDVLWVKGSGGDLRTAQRSSFASLCLDKLLALQDIYDRAEHKGPKTPAEDAMVDLYRHTVYNLNPVACSIDTPLHGLIPFRHVDHTHPVAIIAIAASKDQERLTRAIFGDEVAWVPWQRPGFDLGLRLRDMVNRNPRLRGIILGQHGLIDWAGDDKACYENTLDLIERAGRYLESHDNGSRAFGGQRYAALDEAQRRDLLVTVLPRLRGMVSRAQRFIATAQSGERVLQFANSAGASRLAELGTSCPDHFLRTKIKPLYVDWDPQQGTADSLLQRLEEGLEVYRRDYNAYYESCKHPDSPPMRDANPTVILIPGVGMITWGKNKSESRITAEFYSLAIDVMRGAESVSSYQGLPRQEAFDIEYWLLEEAKLRRLPPEREMARQVAVVIGAGSGIGRAVAQRLAVEGAHVVCADVNEEAAKATAQSLPGSAALGLDADITRRESVRAMFEQVVLAYGGLDGVVVTAGIFVPPAADGHIPDDKWALTYAINVSGSYIVADEAQRIWQAQGLPGSLVLTTSVNGIVPKLGSLAYDTSKAAAGHLVRELAIELAPLVRVNGLAPATVVEGSAMFPRQRVVTSLEKYGISFSDGESTEDLRARLAGFYAQRTLTGAAVTAADQAEIAYLLCSSAFAKTTGQIINVDGGLPEAFMR